MDILGLQKSDLETLCHAPGDYSALMNKKFFNTELSNSSDTNLSRSHDQPHSYYLNPILSSFS